MAASKTGVDKKVEEAELIAQPFREQLANANTCRDIDQILSSFTEERSGIEDETIKQALSKIN
jgi:hypothetical protein